METTNYWSIFKNNFKNIIEMDEYYNNLLNLSYKSNINMLLYSIYGFPIELFVDEIIKKKFNITYIYKVEYTWNKNIIYYENKNFIEIDLSNPNMSKDFSILNDFLLNIIKLSNIINNKHFIIIKNIDYLSNYFFAFRILLEKFSKNAYFLCTTYKISKIEAPIKSRFTLFRIPLFTHDNIKKIFENNNIPLHKYLIENKTRNIINAIFIAQVEKNEPELITYEFCNYNYPPLFDFIEKKDYSIENIRQLSYKCCQYNLSISQLTNDLLLKKNKKNIHEFIKQACSIDNILVKTNKGREPIYIEALLSQYFL